MMSTVKAETDSTAWQEDADGAQKCDVCLEEKVCMSLADPIFGEKNVLAIFEQHLHIKIALAHVCRCCWNRLNDFDDFYKMVNETHHNTIQNNPDRNDELTVESERTFGTEFVEIKSEPLAEDVNATVKEEKESILDSLIGSNCDNLSEHSTEEENADVLEDDADSLSSKDSVESYSPRPSRSKSKTPASKKSKVDHELLDFYKRLVCEICDAEQMLAGAPSTQYSNLRDLNKHMRKVHELVMASIKCPVCDKKFRSRAKLLEHREMHLNPDRFRCAICNEVHQNLAEHMKNKHQERTFCCEECGKRFPFKARLSAHIRKIHTAKDVKCDQCQKCFSKYTIEDHKRAVHGSKFICEHCPRTFKMRFSLEQHMEEHVEGMRNVAAVTCPECGVVLRNKYNLLSHIKRMHTETPPVSCSSCGKVFKSKHNLNAHLANVCTERTFPCPICSKTFKKKIKLKEHMTTHTKSALYQCPYCPKTFSFETVLYTHRKQAHYEQWLEMQRKRKEGVRFKVNRVTDMPSV